MIESVVQVVPKGNRFTDLVPSQQDTTITKRKRRPARRQADARTSANALPPQTGQIFNIWYGKWSGGDREDQSIVKDQAESKCDPVRDSGWTKADKTPGSFFCLFFAKGCCPNGPDCQYLHRLPQSTDMYSPNVDCFGRDKHADYRDDMGGVGSFLRQNHTLYIGRITTTDDIEEAVSNAFCQWGEVERIRVLNSRGVAFVTYVHQNAAEFAKEAMDRQALRNNETLNVRWATQDPNPEAAARDQRRAEQQAVIAIRRALPQEFLDELEGTGEKRKRLDYGLEGYQPPDELWYQRGLGAINPAGKTKGLPGHEPQLLLDGNSGKQQNTVDEVKVGTVDAGIIKGRALDALKALSTTRRKELVASEKNTTLGKDTAVHLGDVIEEHKASEPSGLVAYGSDEDSD